MVETANTPHLVNIKEGAYGISQIRQIKLNEYNRITGSKITLHDCFNEEISRQIFYWHCSRYNNIETAVKRWNGSGPKTEIYWTKIKRYL
jgi:hypothetical protein